MGEAKRKRDKMTPAEREGLRITHKLVNDGKLLQGGFAAYLMSRKMDPSDPRMPELYDVYMMGAEHLWASIMATLDPGRDETPADMRRMDAIQNELNTWRKMKMDVLAKNYETKGNA